MIIRRTTINSDLKQIGTPIYMIRNFIQFQLTERYKI